MQTTGGVDPREAQRSLYGAPVADLVSAVTSGLGITQGRVAEVLGLSAPMLSQLVSGHRVKIGNPAVVHRLRALLDLVDRAPTMSPDAVAARLADVREEHPTLTGQGRVAEGADADRAVAVGVLRGLADASGLVAAAVAVGPGPVADLLREAAGAAPADA